MTARRTKPEPAAPMAWPVAESINTINPDTYAIVGYRDRKGVWEYTLPASEIGLLRHERDYERVFMPQAKLDGQVVLLARIVRRPKVKGRR